MAKTFRLPNGVTCVCEERPKTGKVSMRVVIRAGSMDEGADESGLTHLMQEASWGGTTTKTRDQIAEAIESRGGSFASDTDRESTIFSTSALTRDADAIFAVLADVVRNPSFPADEVETTKSTIAYMIDEQNQSPGYKAGQALYDAAYQGQRVAAAPVGTKALVASYTPGQIKKKHAEILAYPENIVLSFAGEITPARAKKLAQAYFGDLPSSPASPRPAISFLGGDIRESNENNQLNLTLGLKAPALNDPRRLNIILLREVLSGGMSSPLFQEVREKRGLVYSVSAGYSAMDSTGLFTISAGTGKGNAGELIPVALGLLGDAVRNGFSDDELKQARERITRSVRSSLESASAACARNANQILNFGRIIPVEELEAQLERVTSADIQASTAEMLQGGAYALGGVGPQDSMPDPQAIHALIAGQLAGVTVPTPSAPVHATITPAFSGARRRTKTAGNDPKTTVLDNGLVITTIERPGSLACGAWVGAGADHETQALNGATHMNEHMMFKGTPSYGPGVIDRVVEGEMGGALNAYTSKDQTAYYFYNLLPQHLEKTIDICGEMVFQANIAQEEFDGHTTTNPDGSTTKAKGERDVVIEEIKRSHDNIGHRLWDLLAATACPGQAHGRTVLGTEDTLRAMTAKDLAAYRDGYYGPNNVIFCAAGPVKHKDFVALIKRKFGAMSSRAIPALPTPTFHGGVGAMEMHSANLCQFVLAVKSVPGTDPEAEAWDALGEILGGGASSRLHKALVNTGLTSGVFAGCNDYRNFGSFVIGAGIEPADTRKVLSIVFQEIQNLLTTLNQAELDKAKAQMEMGLLSSVETNRKACDSYGQDTLARGKPETPAEAVQKIRALTLGDIERVAKAVLTCDPVLAAIVPEGTDMTLLPGDLTALKTLRDKPGLAPAAHPAP